MLLSLPEYAPGVPAPFQLATGPAGRSGPKPFRMLTAIRAGIFLLLIANLGRIPLLTTSDRAAPLYFNDVFIVLILGLGAMSALLARSFRLDRLMMLALIFSSIGAYSAVLAVPRYGLTASQMVVSLAYLARWLAYFGVYAVTINTVRSDDAVSIWRTLESTILAFTAFGLVQAVFIPHFAQVVYPESRVMIDFDEQGHRLVSTVLEPNMAGAMIMLVLLIHLAQLAAGQQISTWKPLLLFAGLVATLSRSSFLGLIVGSILILSVRGLSRRIVRAIGVVGVLLLLAAPKLIAFANSYNKLGIDGSALTRLASWVRALSVFVDHPILGVGFNTFGFVSERYGYTRMGTSSYSTDGGLLFIAVMTGIVGLAMYVGMLALVVKRCMAIWRNADAPVEWRALATGIAAGTIALCVHSCFVNSLLTPFVMEPFYLLWALAFLMARALASPPAVRERQMVIAFGGAQ